MHDNTVPKTVKLWIEKNQDKVESYHMEHDEFGEISDGAWSVWVYLTEPYWNVAGDCSCIHAATVSDFKNETKFFIEKRREKWT